MIKELLEFEILEIDAASEYWKGYLPNLGQDWQISSFSIFRITSVAQQWIISQISEYNFSFFWIHFSCFSDFDILFCARSWHEPLFIHRSSLWRTSSQHRHTQTAARISLWCGLIQFFGVLRWSLLTAERWCSFKVYLNDGKKKLVFWQFFERNAS